ncbi:MAG TPA: hypothetical protein VLE43_21170 [Candidatus Saccharimonadia bacterium]|nr:hypothetical protein [Candidatus Saccharimonadia bacterium]
MKRLILIQNDFAGAGKTTLAQCFEHYLNLHRVPHHSVVVAETVVTDSPRPQLDGNDLGVPEFLMELDQSDLVVMEIETGMTEAFQRFFEKCQLDAVLNEVGYDLTVAVPVTGEEESFDGVMIASEVYADAAQYLIVHTPTGSSYDRESRLWERSHAARVMDMFEAVDMMMPPATDALEFQLKMRHTELHDVIHSDGSDAVLHTELSKWLRKTAVQLDVVKKYAFGDAFRPEVHVISVEEKTKKRRGRKPKGALMEALAAA